MVRGIYTGAAGMISEMHRMDIVSNNLANADKTGYKRDTAIFKSFPEMLIRRANDDGVVRFPLGSYDTMPMVGKMGTGVEMNEAFTRFNQGSLKQTHNPFDLAMDGEGFFTIKTDRGLRYTRNGSFLIDKNSFLVTKDGHRVMGENGPIQVKKHNFVVDKDGRIIVNADEQDDHQRLTDNDKNEWKRPKVIDRLKIVNFENLRYLDKQGNSFFNETKYSGPAKTLEESSKRPQIMQGFLEASNVNPVTEMVKMIEVQRSYEASQKAIQSHDQTLNKLINQVGRM